MRRRLVLVLAALFLALTGTILVVVGGGRSGAEAAPQAEEQQAQTVPVLVALKLIPAGTTGQEIAEQGFVELRDMPAAAVPVGAVADVVPLREFVAGADIQAGEMLFQAKFVNRSQAGSVKIPDDKVAVSLQVDAAYRVNNFVQPGTEVAVFATYGVEAPAPKPLPAGASEWPAGSAPAKVDTATRLMLPRATVLAVNDTTVQGLAATPPAEGQTQESNAVVITLAVSVEEAQKVAHASQTDKITLALLSDKSRTGTDRADDNRTLFN